jgi:hypothetical protein
VIFSSQVFLLTFCIYFSSLLCSLYTLLIWQFLICFYHNNHINYAPFLYSDFTSSWVCIIPLHMKEFQVSHSYEEKCIIIVLCTLIFAFLN